MTIGNRPTASFPVGADLGAGDEGVFSVKQSFPAGADLGPDDHKVPRKPIPAGPVDLQFFGNKPAFEVC